MKKRVTVIIDDDMDKKIRNIQTKTIKKENKSHSCSQTINELLKKEIK